MTIKAKLFFVVVIILAGFLIFKATQREFREIEKKTSKEYPILEVTDSISGIVQSIYNPPKFRSSPFYVSINFREGLKYTLSTKGYALDYSDIAIREVCIDGTILKKEVNSDTVKIIFKEEIYKFLLLRYD